MAQQKGGRKLRRTARHKGMYQAQLFRTERNKAAARTRIARRKQDNPCPAGRRHKARAYRRSHARNIPALKSAIYPDEVQS